MSKNADLLLHHERDDTTVIDFFTTDEPAGTDADQKAADLSAAMASERSPYVTIHRIMGAGNMPEEYCTRLPADKFDFGQIQEYIATNFGSGDYRIRLYSSNRLVKGGNKLVQIAPRLTTAPTSVTPAGEASNILAVVLQKMDENNQRMMQLMSQKNAAPDRMEIFRELAMMKEIFGGGNSGGISELKGTIELLAGLGMIKTGETIEHEKDEGFGALLEKMTPLVMAGMQQQPAPQQTPQPQPRQPQQPARESNSMQNIRDMQIKMGIAQLIHAASKNGDCGVYATNVIDLLPENVIQTHVLADNAFEVLSGLEPKVKQFTPWFKLLIEHVKAQLGLPSQVESEYADDNDNVIDSETNPHEQQTDL